jgi:hypothetical protein
MDTIWFAVDQDGHVAGLQSNGAGAAPVARPSLTGDAQDELCGRLREVLPACPVTYDLAGRTTPGPLHRGTKHWAESPAEPRAALMFLRSLDLVAEAIARGDAVQHPATEAWVVVLTNLLPALAHQIHQAGDCLACFYHSEYSEDSDLADHGLFSYKQLLGDWLPGPYGRQRSPVSPVHIDQLPSELRKTIGQVRFESLCFAQTLYLQPIEHMACEAMNAGYLTADGQTVRPVPGHEADYPAFYEEFLSEAPGGAAKRLRIERPPGRRRKRQ